jgi:hypothetical protein
MKKLLLLAAFALLGTTVVSCDNMPDDGTQNNYYATDDGDVPIKPVPVPPVPPVPPKRK